MCGFTRLETLGRCYYYLDITQLANTTQSISISRANRKQSIRQQWKSMEMCNLKLNRCRSTAKINFGTYAWADTVFITFLFCKITSESTLQLIYKLSRSYLFQNHRVFFSELVFITSPSYTSISIAAVGNTI